MKVSRIVVGVDGSENARQAAACAAGLAGAFDAEVVAVHALGLLAHPVPGETVPAQAVRDEVRRELETSWCEPLATAGVRYRSEVRDGNPVSVLLAVADEVGADLLVVGSRGLGGFPELLLGSTSTQVAQHSHRPVVIVPAS